MAVAGWFQKPLILFNFAMVSLQTNAAIVTWHGEDISGLIAGNLASGYSKVEHQSGSFELTSFNPLFLYSYKDLLLMEASLNFSIDDQSNTDASLDTANLNLFLNDYAILGIGKFDSAIGYFLQNLSPNWINKLPSVPVGFDDDEAAPQSEIGLRLRGGFCWLHRFKTNYILYVANGPIAFSDDNGIIQTIHADAVSTNDRGDYVAGGRMGIFPIPKLEVGISGALGKIAVLNQTTNELISQRQNYNVLGADISYKWHELDFRAEIVQQEISIDDEEPTNTILTTGGRWKAWYTQLAYRFPGTGWEPVIRYGSFKTPIPEQNQDQWALGIDYWFAPSLVAKLAYEIHDGLEGSSTDSNVILAQMAFGF